MDRLAADPQSGIPLPSRDGQALEEVPGAVRGRDAEALALEAANAFDGASNHPETSTLRP